MKKYFCILLASLMLAGLVSCGESVPNSNEGLTSDGTNSETGELDPNYVCELPTDLTYGGAEVGILYAHADNREGELISDGPGGDVVSDAVHERNMAVEEQLDVHMNMYPADGDTDVNEKFNQDILGGVGDYDIIVNGTFMAVQPAMEGKYLNLSVLDNINTSKHYWTQGYNDMMTFTDDRMQFLASGPIAISMFRYMYLTIYNKELFESYQLPDLYETVKDGGWTLDYQYSIVKDHYVDTDGDSKASSGDFYGFVTGNVISVDPYLVACDIHMVIKDPDTGDLTYNTSAIKDLSNLCDKIQLLYHDQSTYVYNGVEQDNIGHDYITQHFASGKALMATIMFLKMETNYNELGAMSYGIAPMPKFSEQQASYYSYVQNIVSSFGISSVVTDAGRREMCAAVLESMAYHSNRLIRPAYYETVLSARYMQDPQSQEVLDMIFDTMYFDFSSSCCNVFTTCVIRDNLRPLLTSTTNNIVSSAKSWKNPVEKHLKEYNKILSGIRQ